MAGRETRTLRRGVDFDHVLLAISLGALPTICAELIAASPAWKAMVDAVPTVRTQAMQLWVNKDLESLGWTAPNAPVGTGVEPMDTWADMGQLTARETWPAGRHPKGVSYLLLRHAGRSRTSRTRPTPPIPRAVDPVRKTAIDVSEQPVVAVLAECTHTERIRLAGARRVAATAGDGAAGRAIPARRASTRRIATCSPRPAARRYRLKPGESGFRNLTLAGDWTENTINAGCMEATVMSGLAASRAIAGYPEKIPGEEDFGAAGPRRARVRERLDMCQQL